MINPLYRCPYDDKRDIEFRPITYPGVRPDMYTISNYGDVYSIPSDIIKKQEFDKNGYMRVNLCCTNKSEKRNRKGDNFSTHRLVAHEFIPNKNPEEYTIVNHMDGDPGNPYYGNLEHCTDSYNRRHASDTGLMSRGESNASNVFPESLVHTICSYLQNGSTNREIINLVYDSTYTRKQISDLIRNIHNRTSWNFINKLYNY